MTYRFPTAREAVGSGENRFPTVSQTFPGNMGSGCLYPNIGTGSNREQATSDLSEIDQLRRDFSGIDIDREFKIAARRYGRTPTVGFMRVQWLPRCPPSLPRHKARADREGQHRARVWAIATAKESPADWLMGLASQYPDITPPSWSEAPVDVRQLFARAKLANGER